MAKGDSVSIAEFARQVGRSPQWIGKLIKKGTIPKNPDGKIPLDAGFSAWDAQMKKVDALNVLQGKNKPLTEDDDGELSQSVGKTKNITEAFNKARLAEKTYQAKLKEIEFKLKRGDLIESEKVKADAHQTAAALRGRLVSIPVRIAGLCEGRSAREIEEIIEDAINDALTEFQKSEFLKDNETVG